MKIFLVRHGETDWNKDRRIQGNLNLSDLNKNGIRQAKILSKKLKGKCDVVYSSPLKRALQTAKITSKDVKTLTGLMERDFGEWNGKYWKDIKRETPRLFKVYHETRDLSGIKGAEDLKKLQKRSWETFLVIVKENKNKNILVVSHGSNIRVILAAILGLPIKNISRLHTYNCSVSLIEYDEDENKFSVERINCV